MAPAVASSTTTSSPRDEKGIRLLGHRGVRLPFLLPLAAVFLATSSAVSSSNPNTPIHPLRARCPTSSHEAGLRGGHYV
ncbi:hypothetical protein GUJ93_ZPchr0007g5831 [Zizania palustris]|uniref:Uncharacterized protein n=1 Tax=Zizania palustris TaxID=103762 RepID=A0A8J5TGL8_ZIZPA|nr:hypothetical protein GUJ93_ZPchr0007g5831 [Zizania palustris]